MSDKLVNGEGQKSHFVSHLASYPLVSDGISTYKSNPYGQKSLSLANDIYSRIAAPLLPYLRGPYSYLHPYVTKADELGSSGLDQIDSRFPIVKEDTATIKDTVFNYASFPVRAASEGRDYVFKTYDGESKKVSGQGLPHLVKTIVSTELKIASDTLHYLAEWLGPKKDKAKKALKDGQAAAEDKANEVKDEVKN